ncbi:MAG TPA: DUF4276 family protein [Terriglobia bacterium]|nr:DUF4276 family protein [Terriglobia bacterium]
MKIALLIEGDTERTFLPHLRRFLETRLAGRMPRLDPDLYHGRIPKDDRLKREVDRLLRSGNPPADAVIALTDVYTGKRDFQNADDAKKKMREWVGENTRFFPHAAQHEFEAWLLPFWDTIQHLAGHNKAAPGGSPEAVNHDRPPSVRIEEIFRVGKCRGGYVKPRDAGRILRENDLLVAAKACPELRAFLNTILNLCGGECL